MSNLQLARQATKIVVQIATLLGTAKITSEIVQRNVETDTNASKAAVAVSSFALGGIAADQASTWWDGQIDNIFDLFEPPAADTTDLSTES